MPPPQRMEHSSWMPDALVSGKRSGVTDTDDPRFAELLSYSIERLMQVRRVVGFGRKCNPAQCVCSTEKHWIRFYGLPSCLLPPMLCHHICLHSWLFVVWDVRVIYIAPPSYC